MNVLNLKCSSDETAGWFYGLEMLFKPGGCLVLSGHFYLTFIFLLSFLRIHAVTVILTAAQYEHALLPSATEQLCRTDGPESKECSGHGALAALWMSSSGLMNTQTLLSLSKKCSHFLSTILFTVHRSTSVNFLACSFTHLSLKYLQYRIQVNEMLPCLFNVPAQICTGFCRRLTMPSVA